MAPGVLGGSFLRGAHPMFDLGEGLLDRIEIGRVWRQIPEPGACGADHLPDSNGLVGAEIVHDDDVAGLEHRHELLLDIGAEAVAVDRSIEDARGSETVEPQGAEKGQRAPVAVWGKAAQAFAARSPAPQRSHVGLDPGFVDKHQPFWIETRLPGAPALPSPRNVGASLLKGEQGFF